MLQRKGTASGGDGPLQSQDELVSLLISDPQTASTSSTHRSITTRPQSAERRTPSSIRPSRPQCRRSGVRVVAWCMLHCSWSVRLPECR